jgi:thermostable hemolysin
MIMEAMLLANQTKFSSAEQLKNERLLLPNLPLSLVAKHSHQRAHVEHYIAEHFYSYYQAQLASFLPYFLATHSENQISSALGFHPAHTGEQLFLEQYLDHDIQSTLGRLFHRTISREDVVEIGNLTSSKKGSSHILFVLTAAILYEAGYKWVVFTATKQVETLLTKLGLTPVCVCNADPERLSDQGSSWGSYYDQKPKVLAGNLLDAIPTLYTHRVIGGLLQNYQHTISSIAMQVKP